MDWPFPGPQGLTDEGGIRPQFHHVIDVVPTLLEAVGVPGAQNAQRRGSEAHRRREYDVQL